MSKLLYIAAVEIKRNKPDGVAKKVMNHVRVFKDVFDTILLCYGENGIKIEQNGGDEVVAYRKGLHRKFQIYSLALELCKSHQCDYVYIRYPRSDPKFLNLVKKIHTLGSQIVIEIPTYPYGLEVPHKAILKSNIYLCVDKYYRNKLKKYVQRIVTYSDDPYIWGIQTIQTINGISFDYNRIRHCADHESINLISCAYYYECHGCDRLIRGIKKYYDKAGDRNIVFHIVGEGSSVPQYKELVKELKIENHVIFHGFCTGDKLATIYDISDIGVNSLAIHRLGLKKESTLKTKEYAAKGLPVISSYPVDAFSKKDQTKYVHLVPGDDSDICVQEIVNFYDRIYDGDKQTVANSIRTASKNVCDMRVTLNPVISFYMGNRKEEKNE